MDISLLANAVLAAAIVVLTPGPAVLALLNIGASQGRKAGAGFVFGHLVGDVLWATLALIALVWANVLSPVVFKVLGLFCAAYLAYLGFKALRSKGSKVAQVFYIQRPLWLGFTFGLSNPKSYPVTLSLFAAILGEGLNNLRPANAPVFLLACLLGFILADLVLIWLIGLDVVRSTYQRFELSITRATGVLFLYFASSVLWHTLR
jgi:threonine/homoserine/homoserine lactone efflux protein